MADVHQMITLGIGTPSDITHLVLTGLSIGEAVTPEPEIIEVTGRYRPIVSVTGRHRATVSVTGRHRPSLTVTARWEGE